MSEASGKGPKFETMSGLPIADRYGPEEVPESIGEPGEFPFTRGPYASMYHNQQ